MQITGRRAQALNNQLTAWEMGQHQAEETQAHVRQQSEQALGRALMLLRQGYFELMQALKRRG